MKVWTLYSVSRLKFKMLFDHPISHSLTSPSWRLWWIENILSNTRHLEDSEVKRRKIWSPQLHIACHVWNLKSFLIIQTFDPCIFSFTDSSTFYQLLAFSCCLLLLSPIYMLLLAIVSLTCYYTWYYIVLLSTISFYLLLATHYLLLASCYLLLVKC